MRGSCVAGTAVDYCLSMKFASMRSQFFLCVHLCVRFRISFGHLGPFVECIVTSDVNALD